jgi:hypothetical protein
VVVELSASDLLRELPALGPVAATGLRASVIEGELVGEPTHTPVS